MNLPTKQEWEAFGFSVPLELCAKPSKPMTLTHIANLLDPLQAAIVMQSWEDAEDIAKEITRLSRLKRLSELEKIQEALKASGSHQGLNGKSAFDSNPQIAPEGSQVAKTPLPGTLWPR